MIVKARLTPNARSVISVGVNSVRTTLYNFIEYGFSSLIPPDKGGINSHISFRK